MVLTEKRICSGVWSVLFFLIAIEPYAFTFYRISDILYEIAIFCMFAVVFFFHINMIRRGIWKSSESLYSRIPYLILLYYGYIWIVTLLRRGNVAHSVFMRGIQFVNFAMYVDMVLKNNPKAFFKTGLNILTFYIFLNCITYFAFPNGLYSDEYFDHNYLLGYDNQNINFILPALILVLIKHKYYEKCTLQILVTYVVSLITVIKAWSGMSLVIVFSTSIFAFFFFGKKSGFVVTRIFNGKIFNLFNLFIINIVSFLGLVILRFQNYFEFFIVGVLNKSITLSGRIYIWNDVIKLISKNPIFGYGQESAAVREAKSNANGLIARVSGLHAHNRFLEVTYSGGIILLGIYLYMLLYTIQRLNMVRYTSFGKILAFGIFIYLMGMLTEQYPYCPFFWIFMVIAENAVNCIKKSQAGMDL